MNAENTRTVTDHEALQDALPWYANGSLPEAEAARVQDHLRSCAACREDLAWQRKLLETEGPLPSGLDPERALARLMPRLDAAPAPAPQRQRSWLGSWLAPGRWQFAAMAAQLAVIAVLAVQLLPKEQPSSYQALGRGQASTPDLLVVFRADARVQDVQRLLQANGARIVGGPTVAGAYMLDVDPDRAAALLAALRADPAVDLAETLAETQAPGSPP